MNYRIWLVSFTVALMVSFSCFSQQGSNYDYGREFTWGVTKATNSGLIGGVSMKYALRHRNNAFHYFGMEIVNIKHPKEERYYSFTGNTYIYGKSNYLYSIRTQFGREWIMFKKAPQQGVQIAGIVSGGPSLGVEAPYYIEYHLDNDIVREQYDPNIHFDQNNILGTGNLLQGIGESSLALGFNTKASLAFEFGTIKYSVIGLEAGFMVEGFTKKIPIIPTAEQQAIFPNAFITLYYGSRK